MNMEKHLKAYSERWDNDESFREMMKTNPDQALKDLGVEDVAQFKQAVKEGINHMSEEALEGVSGGVNPAVVGVVAGVAAMSACLPGQGSTRDANENAGRDAGTTPEKLVSLANSVGLTMSAVALSRALKS